MDLKDGSFIRNKNDISLLRLREKIVFSSTIKPACLQVERKEEAADVELTVTGWGATENSQLFSDRFITIFTYVFFINKQNTPPLNC